MTKKQLRAHDGPIWWVDWDDYIPVARRFNGFTLCESGVWGQTLSQFAFVSAALDRWLPLGNVFATEQDCLLAVNKILTKRHKAIARYKAVVDKRICELNKEKNDD